MTGLTGATRCMLHVLCVSLLMPFQLYASRLLVGNSIHTHSFQPTTVPEWLFNVKNYIIASIADDRWHDYQPISNSAVQMTIDHMEPLSVDANAYDLHAEREKVLIDMTDLRMKLRIHIKKIQLFARVPLLTSQVAGGTYIDVDVQGGLRAGFLLEADGQWYSTCSDDGSIEALPPLLVTPTLHLNALYNRIDVLGPYVQPIIRRTVCMQVKYKLDAQRSIFEGALRKFVQGRGVVYQLLQQTRVLKAMHLDEDCWMYGCRGGPCHFCGTGYCCRQGYFAGGCDGSSGDPDRHVCVTAPPKPEAPLNLGKECWNAGNCRSGRCGYCGNGLCCKNGVPGGECNGEMGGEGEHQCVEAPWFLNYEPRSSPL